MYVDKTRGGGTEGECAPYFFSFLSVKQSFFSSPGFKRNLVPGWEPTLTLTLSLRCSMAPIVVSREPFHNYQPKKRREKKNSTWNYFWVNIILLPSFSSLLSVFLSLSLFFVSNLFPNSGLRKGSQGQRAKTLCHVAASGVCISSAQLKSFTQMAFFFLFVPLCFSSYK